MALFTSRKWKEFWGFMAAAVVFYGLSTLFKADLKNILTVASAILFVVALLKLRKPS